MTEEEVAEIRPQVFQTLSEFLGVSIQAIHVVATEEYSSGYPFKESK